jgi:hypothetical protein
MRTFLVLPAALLVLWTFAASAEAGTYEVLACHSDGRSDAWQPSTSNGATAAYKECPGNVTSNGHTSDGMMVRNTGDPNSPAPPFSAGQMTFEAPPGARIVAIRGEAQMLANGSWQAGIHDESNNRWLWCGPGCSSTFGANNAFNVSGISSTRVSALLICGGTCSRDGNQGYVKLFNVVVTIADDSAPSVAIAETGLASPGWHRGDQPVVAQVGDNVGIRRYDAFLEGRPFDGGGFAGCNSWTSVPCPQGEARMKGSTFAVADGERTLVVRATDSSGNIAEASHPVRVDNHAPGPPRDLRLVDISRWSTINRYELAWRNPDPDGAAPVSGAEFRLCPASNTAADPKGCVEGSRDGENLTGTQLEVPSAGAWRLNLWLRDAAGNADPASAQIAEARFDPEAPSASFLSSTTDDPTRVRVLASDSISGLARGVIELRRVGATSWSPLETERSGEGYVARLPDENLPDGAYALRAMVADAAGNERSTNLLGTGEPATVTLPIRIKTRLAVGKLVRVPSKHRHGRTRTKFVTAPRTSYGRRLRLAGRLTTPGGNALPNAPVEVSQQAATPGAKWERLALLRASKTGRFSFKVSTGASRTLRFRYGGTSTVRGRTSDVHVLVRATTSLRPSRRSVVNGEDVVFRGRLKGRPLSPTSKLVQLQAYTRRRWATFATPRANPTTGLWSYRYRFAATRGNVVYRIRAVIPKEASYPFETGRSRPVRVRVRGL